MGDYQPSCTLTTSIPILVAEVSGRVGIYESKVPSSQALYLRRVDRIRTIQGTLAIEGNTLINRPIAAILVGETVIAPPAGNLPALMKQLFRWLGSTDLHPLGLKELLSRLGLSDPKNLRERYMNPALEAGLIKRTLPYKPNNRLQKYRRKPAP
jgi:hypothetical protein